MRHGDGASCGLSGGVAMSAARKLDALFSAATGKWSTPVDVYAALDAEFGFTLDPCPIDDAERIMEFDGLARSWAGERVFCNPPYGPGVSRWLAKATEADVAVYLLPSRTDVAWWHDYAMHANEIRFIRGRLKFGGSSNSAPFPSAVLVFRAPMPDKPTGAADAGGPVPHNETLTNSLLVSHHREDEPR